MVNVLSPFFFLLKYEKLIKIKAKYNAMISNIKE